MSPGEISWADPAVGRRPIIVVSREDLNRGHDVAAVGTPNRSPVQNRLDLLALDSYKSPKQPFFRWPWAGTIGSPGISFLVSAGGPGQSHLEFKEETPTIDNVKMRRLGRGRILGATQTFPVCRTILPPVLAGDTGR
jgi:hypothetical protein